MQASRTFILKASSSASLRLVSNHKRLPTSQYIISKHKILQATLHYEIIIRCQSLLHMKSGKSTTTSDDRILKQGSMLRKPTGIISNHDKMRKSLNGLKAGLLTCLLAR